MSWVDGLQITVNWYRDMVHGKSYWPNYEYALTPHPWSPPFSQSFSLYGTERKAARHTEFFLVFGRSGWIGGLLGDILTARGLPWCYANARLEDRAGVVSELLRTGATHVLNAAGVTGRPNVDWCETHKRETIRANVVGTLSLVDACNERGVHVTNFATGCVYSYDTDHPMYSGIGFTETDPPNFTGSYYSKTKAIVEELLGQYDNVLQLRLRMPISNDLANPRNFVKKIVNYPKVVNIPNSMTVLDELLPMAVTMSEQSLTGVFNFTNPGVISHNEVLELYRDNVDPSFTWKNFSLEEQTLVLAAPRSNNELNSAKLQAVFPEMLGIKESLMKHVFGPARANRLVSASVRTS